MQKNNIHLSKYCICCIIWIKENLPATYIRVDFDKHNQFMANVIILYTPWKHQKIFGFLLLLLLFFFVFVFFWFLRGEGYKMGAVARNEAVTKTSRWSQHQANNTCSNELQKTANYNCSGEMEHTANNNCSNELQHTAN